MFNFVVETWTSGHITPPLVLIVFLEQEHKPWSILFLTSQDSFRCWYWLIHLHWVESSKIKPVVCTWFGVCESERGWAGAGGCKTVWCNEAAFILIIWLCHFTTHSVPTWLQWFNQVASLSSLSLMSWLRGENMWIEFFAVLFSVKKTKQMRDDLSPTSEKKRRIGRLWRPNCFVSFCNDCHETRMLEPPERYESLK